MRALLILSLALVGCRASSPFHVLIDGEGRPMRVYEHPYSCQVAAVWYLERGHEVECMVMSRARLLKENMP